MKKNKSYSRKVNDLITEDTMPSLKILLEENEEDSEPEKKDSEESEASNKPEDSGDAGDSGDSGDFSFDFDDEDESEDEAEDTTEPEDTKEPEGEPESSVTPESLKSLLKSYVDDFTGRINRLSNVFTSAFSGDPQATSHFNKALTAGYYKKSLQDFLFEANEDDEVDPEELESLKDQIEMISSLSDLLDDKFNRPSAMVTWEDIPHVVEKSIELINTHDPVSYAHDEAIKYLDVKTSEKQTQEIKDEFNRLFNEKCQELDIESPELVTGVETIEPVNYNNGISGQSS